MGGMDASELRRWCLEQAGAVEDFPFGPGALGLKVGGKAFSLSALDRTPLEVSVKCEPELAIQLRASYAAIRLGYHRNNATGTRSPATAAFRTSSFATSSKTRTTSSATPCRSACATTSRRGGDAGTAGRLSIGSRSSRKGQRGAHWQPAGAGDEGSTRETPTLRTVSCLRSYALERA
jgi:hypothetical protein